MAMLFQEQQQPVVALMAKSLSRRAWIFESAVPAVDFSVENKASKVTFEVANTEIASE